MPVDSPHAVVERHVAALNHGDLGDVLATFDETAIFTSDGGTARGHVQLAALFGGVVGGDRPTTILRRAATDGDEVDCRLTRRFTLQDERGHVAAAHDVEVRAVFEVADGLITSVRVDPPT